MSLEDTLASWAKPPSDAEKEKADNAARIIKETIDEAESLSAFTLDVIHQGSYRARTNVRLGSDVDICVLCRDEYVYDLGFSDMTPADLPGGPGAIVGSDLKGLVEKALVARFGRTGVVRGTKAFDVHANTYRLDADVVVAFPHKRFPKKAEGGVESPEEGVQIIVDSGSPIINWPEQTYDNGVAKNKRTRFRYKAAIRILKRTRNAMQDKKIVEAQDIASFLIESLVWNVPDPYFDTANYTDLMRGVIAHAHDQTLNDDLCKEWGEVNELKYLFRPGQGWKRERANKFLRKAWDVLGYK